MMPLFRLSVWRFHAFLCIAEIVHQHKHISQKIIINYKQFESFDKKYHANAIARFNDANEPNAQLKSNIAYGGRN